LILSKTQKKEELSCQEHRYGAGRKLSGVRTYKFV